MHIGNDVWRLEMDYDEDKDEHKIFQWLYRCTDYADEETQGKVSSLFHCYCNFHGEPLVGLETFTKIVESNFCLVLNKYGREVAKQFNYHSGLSDEEVNELTKIGEAINEQEREDTNW